MLADCMSQSNHFSTSTYFLRLLIFNNFFLDYFGFNQKNQLVFISLYTQLILILFSAFVCGSAAIALYFILNALEKKALTTNLIQNKFSIRLNAHINFSFRREGKTEEMKNRPNNKVL